MQGFGGRIMKGDMRVSSQTEKHVKNVVDLVDDGLTQEEQGES